MHGAGDVFGLSHAAHGRHLQPDPLALWHSETLQSHVGADVTRRDAVHAHPAPGPFGRQRLGEHNNRRFGSVVSRLRLGLVDNHARHRGDADDCPTAARQHVPANRAAAPENPVEIDIHHIKPLLIAGVLGIDVMGDAGVVDQNVNLRKGFQRRRRHAVDAFWPTDVDFNEHRLPAQRLDLGRRLLTVFDNVFGNDDVSAGRRQFARRRQANPAPSAGNQGRLST